MGTIIERRTAIVPSNLPFPRLSAFAGQVSGTSDPDGPNHGQNRDEIWRHERRQNALAKRLQHGLSCGPCPRAGADNRSPAVADCNA